VRQSDGTVKEINRRKGHNGETWATKEEALAWLHDQQAEGRKGTYVEPSKQKLGDYGAEVIAGLRLKPQTRASYVKNWRNHVEPYPLASLPLGQVTGAKLTAHYRLLETSGRKDHREGEGLSARTTRYLHTTIHRVLRQAVMDGLLARNPADLATPPTASEAKPPEMTCWSAAQLAAFLSWARENAANYPLWHVLAHTGKRRGEALAARWRGFNADEGTLTVRRSAGMVRTKGKGAEMVEGDTKTSKPRVIDLDPATVAVLKAWRKERGSLALQLARDDALIFGDLEDAHRNGEHVSRQFARDIARCREALGEDALPVIRLHDLRHTHATLLLTAREPVQVVSQRLGHASPVITMTVYAHVLPGSQREAAERFAAMVQEAEGVR
jgi:integrase